MSATDVHCMRMTRRTAPDARALLGAFLDGDAHYRASASQYGDRGAEALDRAIELFLDRPEIGFIWLASVDGRAVAACVVCYAISTSRGTMVAKLDDVTVHPEWQGKGVGGAMVEALRSHLRGSGMSRIDCGCHRDNAGAWRFYERLGFRPLDEERLALLI